MSIRLSDDEAWAMIEDTRTGILTTLRADGRPVSLPIWFVTLDRVIYTQTPAKAKKIARVRRDPRASFLVERGDRWIELVGVHVECTAAVEEDDGVMQRARDALDVKYAGRGVPERGTPDATKQRYRQSVVLSLTPTGKLLTWDNARLQLG
jgi:PPOX class probable F420-dependent enzyme